MIGSASLDWQRDPEARIGVEAMILRKWLASHDLIRTIASTRNDSELENYTCLDDHRIKNNM